MESTLNTKIERQDWNITLLWDVNDPIVKEYIKIKQKQRMFLTLSRLGFDTIYFQSFSDKNSIWIIWCKKDKCNIWLIKIREKNKIEWYLSSIPDIVIKDNLLFLEALNKTLNISNIHKYLDILYTKFKNNKKLSFNDYKDILFYNHITNIIKLKSLELNSKKFDKPNLIKSLIDTKTIRPIDLLLLKTNWQISEQDYQKYLSQVKELLKTQLTDEYYKIFLQIPNFFPFSHITQKELDFYAGKIKEYKASIPWMWEIVLKLDNPIISEQEYQEYSKKLAELKEEHLGETQQDILNLQEEIKFNSINDLIQSIRDHKLKEFWKIKEEYWTNKDKEKLRENILKLVEKHYKPYDKLSDEEKKLVEKLIVWVEVNSK